MNHHFPMRFNKTVSVVLLVSDAPDCSGIVIVEMVVPLDGWCCFFGCFDFVIVSTVEAQMAFVCDVFCGC
jgi:hypothetical protein